MMRRAAFAACGQSKSSATVLSDASPVRIAAFGGLGTLKRRRTASGELRWCCQP